MPGLVPAVTRILSDLHYGDRASLVGRLEQLAPLLRDADQVVINGDSMDTRPGPDSEHTARVRAEIEAMPTLAEGPVSFVTGNHDPDVSATHWHEFAAGEVFVTHGDVLFDDLVPWGRDAATIRRLIATRLQARGLSAPTQLSFAARMALWREIAASIPQRHQSERNRVKYAARFLLDTVWPPTRFFRIFGAWASEPIRAARLIGGAFPRARYAILGHTHRPAIRRAPNGLVVINTGSFTAPFGGYAVELSPGNLRVFRVGRRGGEFRRARQVAEFPLANR